jgi:hypothetical protein
MPREIKEIAMHDGRVRYVVTVIDEAFSDAYSAVPQMTQGLFLRYLADNPRLLECGPAPFESLTIRHNGRAWVAEAMAIVKMV